MSPVKRSTFSSLSDRGVPGRRGFAKSIPTLALGFLISSLLALTALAQERIITHGSPDYPSGPPYAEVPSPDTYKFRDMRDELRNKTTGTFTLSTVGDLFFQVPVSQRMSPQLRDALRNADITAGNFEGGVSPYPEQRAKVMADLGFDLLAPGEQDSVAEIQARAKYLAPLGIQVAGAGMTLAEARKPVLQEVPQGLVAFLAACPGRDLCGDPATATGPGMNPLGLTVWNTVTATQFNQLKALRDSILARRTEPGILLPSALPPDEPAGRIVLFGQNYVIADKPGEIHYEVDKADEQAQILAVRNAKEIADFVIFHMHVHQNRFAFQHYSIENYPPDFQRPFIHKLIDNGLDMYFGSGVHTMQGIEIYKGRPIFYNHGNLGADLARRITAPVGRDSDGLLPGPAGMTPTERNERTWLNSVFWRDTTSSMAYIGNTIYKDGRLSEIRIYPVDIALGKKAWSRENIPQTPTPERARFILERIQEYSAPFATKISIENNIGIIRVPPEATVDIGGDLNIPGRGTR